MFIQILKEILALLVVLKRLTLVFDRTISLMFLEHKTLVERRKQSNLKSIKSELQNFARAISLPPLDMAKQTKSWVLDNSMRNHLSDRQDVAGIVGQTNIILEIVRLHKHIYFASDVV
jgi:hypothetical protein